MLDVRNQAALLNSFPGPALYIIPTSGVISMNIVFAITQFVLLSLGTIFLKGMVNANGNISSSPYFQFLDNNWPWFFLLPLASIAYSLGSAWINQVPFTPGVARVIGMILSGLCLIFFASVMFFPST